MIILLYQKWDYHLKVYKSCLINSCYLQKPCFGAVVPFPKTSLSDNIHLYAEQLTTSPRPSLSGVFVCFTLDHKN